MSLELVPATLAHMDALIAGEDAFRDRFGLRLVPGCLGFPEALGVFRQALLDGMAPEWWCYLYIDTQADEVVGLGPKQRRRSLKVCLSGWP